jgi:hypothetical protein
MDGGNHQRWHESATKARNDRHTVYAVNLVWDSGDPLPRLGFIVVNASANEGDKSESLGTGGMVDGWLAEKDRLMQGGRIRYNVGGSFGKFHQLVTPSIIPTSEEKQETGSRDVPDTHPEVLLEVARVASPETLDSHVERPDSGSDTY